MYKSLNEIWQLMTKLSAAFFIDKVCTPLLCLTSKLHHWGHANLPTVQHWIDIWQLCSWHYIQFTRKFQSLSYDLKPLFADQSQHFLQYFEFKEIENVNPNFFRNNWHIDNLFTTSESPKIRIPMVQILCFDFSNDSATNDLRQVLDWDLGKVSTLQNDRHYC